jgi:hypothetical protein
LRVQYSHGLVEFPKRKKIEAVRMRLVLSGFDGNAKAE